MFRKLLEYTLLALFKIVFMVRYRVTVKGLDKLKPENLKKPGGVLILPNHPSVLVDPVLVVINTWKRFRPRPVIVEYMYYTPGVRWLMDMIGGLPIPNFSSVSNSIKKRRSDKALHNLVEAIREGDNVIIYPAGKTKRSGYEEIGGSSGIHHILSKVDDLNIVLIRTTGLWGSSFSRAPTGQPAKMFPMLWKGVLSALKNLIFLTPKREITIELDIADETFPAKGDKMEINRWLEEWYNKPFGTPEGEPLSLVPYSYWNPVKPKVSYKGRHHLIDHQDVSHVSKEIRQDIIRELARIANRDEKTVSEEMTLASDLGLDSLDVADVAAYLSDNYEVKGLTTEDLTTVSQLIAIAARGKYNPNTGKKIDIKTPEEWLQNQREGEVKIAEGKTIIEAFLNVAAECPKGLAVGSDQSGVLNYKQCKLRVILLASEFAKLSGERVGVMLPATAAANLVVLALLLAGKTPVMINWTQGPRHLESVVRASGISVCLTSWAFVERLEGVDFGPIDDMVVMLEEMTKKFSLFQKLKAGMNAMRSTKSVLSLFGANTLSANDHAVILFTSGTEAEPKGVPLTHENILSNLRNSIKVLKIYYSDRVMAILPPFHSFGFTVTGMLPFVTGVPVATFPDPTDGAQVAQSVQRWKATIIAGAPVFLNGVYQAGDSEMLSSLRLIVSGAEKAPASLLEHIQRVTPNARFLEGYGITECSPILSVNLDATQPNGVGRPIPGVTFLVVHPDTHEPLKTGERGLLLCRGPNVFAGYLDGANRDPFLIVNGEKWYNTGDLGYFDDLGNFFLSGRQKRFTKIGGEMISLTAVEEAIVAAASDAGWSLLLEGPSVAVLAEETDKKTVLKVCSTFEATPRELNNALKDAGFSNLVRISEVKKVAEIPLMGSGKVNYRELAKVTEA